MLVNPNPQPGQFLKRFLQAIEFLHSNIRKRLGRGKLYHHLSVFFFAQFFFHGNTRTQNEMKMMLCGCETAWTGTHAIEEYVSEML